MRKSLLVLTLLLTACAVGPRYERPAVELPQSWKENAPRFAEDGRWWRIYDDAQLDKVVEEAIAGNADLITAVARVDESRALVAQASSAYYPRVDANVGATRRQVSQTTSTFFPGIPSKFSDYRGTLDVSYELDLFGRVSSIVSAARADLAASEADREAVRLALAAQVAKAYYALRALD